MNIIALMCTLMLVAEPVMINYVDVTPVTEVTVESEPEVLVESEPEVIVESEPEVIVESEPEVIVESEPEVIVESEPEVIVESEPEVIVESEPEVIVESESEVIVESEPEVTVESEPEAPEEIDLSSWTYDDSVHGVRYTGDAAEVVIPADYEGTAVDAVGSSAFYANYTLESCDIPEGIIAIQRDAFSSCTELAQITIPATVQVFGANAFKFCLSLESVEIPESVMFIGREAFRNCEALRTVTFRGEVPLLGDNVFVDCYSLESILVPDDRIEEYRAVLPEDIEVLGSGEAVRTVESAPDYDGFDISEEAEAIYYYTGNDTVLYIPEEIDGVTIREIDDWAFYSLPNLAAVIIPEGVTSIGEHAFYRNHELTYIEFPSTLKSIGKGAFEYFESSGELVLPESLEEIGDGAFLGLKLLQAEGCGELYLPESLKTIGKNAFWGSRISYIYLPAGIESIGESAFANNKDLEKIVISADIGEIAADAFAGCTYLQTVELQCDPDTLPDGLFSECTSLTEVICEKEVPLRLVAGTPYGEQRRAEIEAAEAAAAAAAESAAAAAAESRESEPEMTDSEAQNPDQGGEISDSQENAGGEATGSGISAESHLNILYVCTGAQIEENPIAASMLGGTYSMLFRENGTMELTMAGMQLPGGLSWSERTVDTYYGPAKAFVIDYYGQELTAVLTETGFELNYFDTMLMYFEPA